MLGFCCCHVFSTDSLEAGSGYLVFPLMATSLLGVLFPFSAWAQSLGSWHGCGRGLQSRRTINSAARQSLVETAGGTLYSWVSESQRCSSPSAHLLSSFLAFQGPRDLDVHMRPELSFLQNLIWALWWGESPILTIQIISTRASAAAWLTIDRQVEAGVVCARKVDTLSCCHPRLHFVTYHSVFCSFFLFFS